jgi:hypothetical protein
MMKILFVFTETTTDVFVVEVYQTALSYGRKRRPQGILIFCPEN